MNNYLNNYEAICDALIRIDDLDPGCYYLAYRLLEDLRDEVADLKTSAKDVLTDGVLQIILDKINRRITYIHKAYMDNFKEDDKIES